MSETNKFFELVRFDEKSIKAIPVAADRFVILDSQDKKTITVNGVPVEVPKVKTLPYAALTPPDPPPVLETNVSHILIEFPEDVPGAYAPLIPEIYSESGKIVRVRRFAGDVPNTVTFDWSTPWDMDVSKPVQYRVKGIVTEAITPDENQSVIFVMGGSGGTDGQTVDQPMDSSVSNAKLFGPSVSQNSFFVTDWSDNLTIPGIHRDSLNQIQFQRAGEDDTYDQYIAVTEIEIKYTKR